MEVIQKMAVKILNSTPDQSFVSFVKFVKYSVSMSLGIWSEI